MAKGSNQAVPYTLLPYNICAEDILAVLLQLVKRASYNSMESK
jgi:hypothetical protein